MKPNLQSMLFKIDNDDIVISLIKMETKEWTVAIYEPIKTLISGSGYPIRVALYNAITTWNASMSPIIELDESFLLILDSLSAIDETDK